MDRNWRIFWLKVVILKKIRVLLISLFVLEIGFWFSRKLTMKKKGITILRFWLTHDYKDTLDLLLMLVCLFHRNFVPISLIVTLETVKFIQG